MKKSNIEHPDVVSFPHDKLLQALYWIWDGFDRANMGMFLVYGTLEHVIQQKDLEGDKVEVGVRNAEWNSGSKPILLDFTGLPRESTDDYVIVKNPLNDVPIYIYLFDEYDCIRHNNQILYRSEYFYIPNPYSEFRELFGTVWEK